MDKFDGLKMIVKIKKTIFASGKERHHYIKSLITEIRKQFNQHTVDLGDWPLVVQIIEDSPASQDLSLRLAKALEPEENAMETMHKIAAYMELDLYLKIDDIIYK